jgi:hypothetical protein
MPNRGPIRRRPLEQKEVGGDVDVWSMLVRLAWPHLCFAAGDPENGVGRWVSGAASDT